MYKLLGFVLFMVFYMSIATANQANNSDKMFNFRSLKTSDTAEGTVTDNNNNGFTLTMISDPQKTHTIAVADFNLTVPSQHKLAFRVKGAATNAAAHLTVAITTKEGANTVTRNSQGITLRNSEFRNIVLALDSDFKLSDAMWNLRQLKFVVNGSGNATGTPVAITVQDVRIVSSDQLSIAGLDLTVIPAKMTKQAREIPGITPIKVYFDFDNDDFNNKIESRVSNGVYLDPPNPASFCQLLLEHADGIITDAEGPDQADVIVYSRVTPGDSQAILDALDAGKRLIVYGLSPDPQLELRLPLQLIPLTTKGFPTRQSFSVADPDHPAFKNQSVNNADFGRYYAVESRAGKKLLTFDNLDNTTLLAQDKNIYHFSTGLGSAILSGQVYYDKLLLRLIAADNPDILAALDARESATSNAKKAAKDKFIADILTASIPSDNTADYHIGMSEQNVGRFGWLIGEGLSCASVANDLTVTNGNQSFRVAMDDRIIAPLTNWSRQPISKDILVGDQPMTATDNVNPLEIWTGEGTVAYTCEWTARPEWRGRQLIFEVLRGIDDCDVTSLNDQEIGKTDENTPNYWSVTRRYVIPDQLINWDSSNKFVVNVINLRGGAAFNSLPQIVVRPTHDEATLMVSAVNWVAKTYQIKAGERQSEMTMSLLSPFVRYQLDISEAQVSLENVAQYAAYSAANGLVVVDLKANQDPQFYLRSRDGAWNAPWLLLYQEQTSHPLLLVFQHQPESLTVDSFGGQIESIKIKTPETVGIVTIGWPWGVTCPDTTTWKTAAGLQSQKEFLTSNLDLALNFPIACDEIFRIDESAKQIEIINRFRYLQVNDDWKTSVNKYATLPPLAAFALSLQSPLVKADAVVDFGINTRLGPTVGVRNTEIIKYIMPLTSADDLFLAGIQDNSELSTTLNEIVLQGLKWSCGGAVPVTAWTPALPASEKFSSIKNIDLFAWNFGMTTMLQGYFFVDKDNRQLLENRCLERYIKPLELYQYKNYTRHREEPFSGLRYPISFNSFYPNNVKYETGFGSTVIYGDANEACTVAVWVGQQLADVYGQAGLIRGNWRFYQEVMRHNLFIDDYAFHAGSCREYGVGAWIDMLNGEYAGLKYYARLAELAGDKDQTAQGLYRAAKRMLPTVLRLSFGQYLAKAYPEAGWTEKSLVTGFGENGPHFMRFPLNNGNHRTAMDLFDFSQGSPGVLYQLYRQYALPEIKDYLTNLSIPSLQENGDDYMSTPYLPPLAMYPTPGYSLEEWATQVLSIRKIRLQNDWPGITVPFHVGCVLWRKYEAPSIVVCQDILMHNASYDPENKKISLQFTAGDTAKLTVESTKKLIQTKHNEQQVIFDNDGRWSLPVSPGLNNWEMQFE